MVISYEAVHIRSRLFLHVKNGRVSRGRKTKEEPASHANLSHYNSDECQIVGITLPPQTGIYAPVM